MYVGKYGRYYSSIESQLGGYAEWAPLANTHDVVFAELATFLLELLRCTAKLASVSSRSQFIPAL